MKLYAILTRFGDYFEVCVPSEDDARFEAETQIEAEGQRGDSIQSIEVIFDGDVLDEPPSLFNGFQAIRDDLAEIMAS